MGKAISEKILYKISRSPKYQGKHVIIIGGKIYATKTGQARTELLEKLLKKYPKEVPLITYMPKEDSLIFA